MGNDRKITLSSTWRQGCREERGRITMVESLSWPSRKNVTGLWIRSSGEELEEPTGVLWIAFGEYEKKRGHKFDSKFFDPSNWAAKTPFTERDKARTRAMGRESSVGFGTL
jgi:hypothetical protein